jgi:AraC family transcriptional regulator, arabinose operon regulatory protein
VDARVTLLLAVMEADPARPLNLGSLAEAVNLSVSRVVHLFTAETGVPPGRYLRDLRLERARQLLTDTRLSVKQVMAAVGYNDASHFSRDFKRNYGVSPRGYRRIFV